MATPRRSTGKSPSLSDLLGKNNDEDKKDDVVTPDTDSNSESDSTTSDVVTPDPVTQEDVNEALDSDNDDKGPSPEDEEDGNSEEAPGDGIISEEYTDEEDEATHRRDVALSKEGVLSRVHKMSPPGMTILNTYSGGSERIDHDRVDVVVKPLGTTEIKRTREISDETGKSRLLHPDVTKPYVPSEQAIVTSTTTVHEYAIPYDPDNDVNNR